MTQHVLVQEFFEGRSRLRRREGFDGRNRQDSLAVVIKMV